MIKCKEKYQKARVAILISNYIALKTDLFISRLKQNIHNDKNDQYIREM